MDFGNRWKKVTYHKQVSPISVHISILNRKCEKGTMRPEAKETIHTKLPENSKEYSPLEMKHCSL